MSGRISVSLYINTRSSHYKLPPDQSQRRRVQSRSPALRTALVMTAAVPLDVPTFQARLERVRAYWRSSAASDFGRCDALMFALGTATDFTVYQKTTAMFSWLLGYEFPETVMLLTMNRTVFLASQRKGAILDALTAADSTVTVIKREKEPGRSAQQLDLAWSLVREAAKGGGEAAAVRLGVLPKDKNEGPLTEEWMAFVGERSPEKIDITAGVGEVLAAKDATEGRNINIAAKLTSALMKEQLIKRILSIVDEGRRRITHVQVADEVESFVSNHVARLKGKLEGLDSNVNLDFVDVCYPPIIQSGGVYSLKPSAMSTEEPLTGQDGAPILCSLGLRYRAYCSNMSRTLLVDPSRGQENLLVFLGDLERHLAERLVPGALLSQVYQDGVEYVRQHRPDLEAHLPTNFGFGIGIEFRAPEYLINAKCQRSVEAGMAFNLVVGIQDVILESPTGAPYSLLLADTVQVGATGPAVLLTCGFEKLSEVSFSLKKGRQAPVAAVPPGGSIIKTRLRSQTSSLARDEMGEKRRRTHQKELGELRKREALERYTSGEAASGEAKKVEVLKFESYRKETMLPKDLGADGSLRIFVDKRAETVILPIYGLAVPFHVNTIKNVTKNEEGDYAYIRFNFNTPGRTFGRKDLTQAPGFEDPTAHFVRGITLRTADLYRAQEVFKEIQELKKQVAEREAARKERADLVEQGQLIEVSGKRPVRLTDVYIRPGMEGKRLPGDVEIHSNGIRYRSQLKSDQRVDVLFANVKHFFFQPCDNETIVVLHLHLHHPIMLGKKKTKDVQFYREALESMVDETSGRRTKMRFGDEDEIAQEAEERRRRAEANEEFQTFAERIVEASRKTLEVDVPFHDLGFSGVPARQTVLVQPTTDCLVQLVEPPFLVVTLAEVEVAFLERVVFGLKNFDLVLVLKDHAVAPVHINTIPMTSLEAVKEWLDSVDVYFVESKVNFNWGNIMKSVNEDPAGFYEEGGWSYLQPDAADADGSEEETGSSEYEPDESDEEDEEEDDDDEEDDEEEYEDSEEDSEEEEEYEDSEEEEDAPDWSDLEEEARREDERLDNHTRKRAAPPSRAPARSTRRR